MLHPVWNYWSRTFNKETHGSLQSTQMLAHDTIMHAAVAELRLRHRSTIAWAIHVTSTRIEQRRSRPRISMFRVWVDMSSATRAAQPSAAYFVMCNCNYISAVRVDGWLSLGGGGLVPHVQSGIIISAQTWKFPVYYYYYYYCVECNVRVLCSHVHCQCPTTRVFLFGPSTASASLRGFSLISSLATANLLFAFTYY